MASPGRAPSPAPETLLEEAAAGLCLSPRGGDERADPPGASPGDPDPNEPGGGDLGSLEQELAALGLPPGGGPRALGGLLRLYREAAAGGARRERELRGLRRRLEPLQGRVAACARAMAAAWDEAERLRDQNRRLWELLGAGGGQGSQRSSSDLRPPARPPREPRGGPAPRRPRPPATETPSAAPRGGGVRATRRPPRTAHRPQGARGGSEPPRAPPRTPPQDLERELQRLREEVAAGREVIALQHHCLQEAMGAALAAPGPPPGPPPGLAAEWGRLRRLRGALARERRVFTEAAERLAREWEQFEAERGALLRQHFLSAPAPWDAPHLWGDPWDPPPELWGDPQVGGGASDELGGEAEPWGSPRPQP